MSRVPVDQPNKRFGLGAVCGAGLLFVPSVAARAAGPFEIQVYDGTADAPGEPGLELHVNDWVTGHRSSGTPPEAPLHGQFHLTLEPSLGVMPFWEVGAYLQFAVRIDDRVGAKLRSKFVTPPGGIAIGVSGSISKSRICRSRTTPTAGAAKSGRSRPGATRAGCSS